jgi:prepilin-type N-terminal cleavage/methylation domain-containing protein
MRERKYAGFSLIEMLVAAAIFSMTITIVSGLYVRILHMQRVAQGAARVQENVLYLVETITREVRVSTISSGDAECTGAVGTGADAITLEHPVYGTVDYRYEPYEPLDPDNPDKGAIFRNDERMTSPDIRLTSFRFCVTGSGADNSQTRMTLLMTAESDTARSRGQSPFIVQTSVASRDLTTDFGN